MITIKNKYQLQILRELMFQKKASYSNLSKACSDHDLFNHHLKELIRKEYIYKNIDSYELTEKGKSIVDFMEEDSSIQDRLKTSLFIWILSENKLLLHKRLKHPYYGYVGSISGKMKLGEKVNDTIKREVKEEVGAEPIDIEILGTKRAMFIDKQSNIKTDGLYLVCLVTKYKGDILYKGIEGEYFWEDIDKVLTYEKMFKKGIIYDILWIQDYIKNDGKYSHMFAEFEVSDLEF